MPTLRLRRVLNLEALEDRRTPATFMVTNLNDSGTGSLRAAIEQANNATGADTVQFGSGVFGTVNLTSGPLVLSDTTGATTINGQSAVTTIVRRNTATPFRVFQVNDDVTATINLLGISNGDAGVNVGGGLLNFGTVTL